jgi:hypothetical protein
MVRPRVASIRRDGVPSCGTIGMVLRTGGDCAMRLAFTGMLKRQPWRRLVQQLCAGALLLSILSTGALAISPWAGAATTPTSGTTFEGGTNPKSPLCQKAHSEISGIRNEHGEVQVPKSGNWSPAYRRSILDVYAMLSQLSQAVIARGSKVPPHVLTASHMAVKNIPLLEGIVRTANNTRELNASPKATQRFISLFAPVLGVTEYIGKQCGMAQGSLPLTPGAVQISPTSPATSTAG